MAAPSAPPSIEESSGAALKIGCIDGIDKPSGADVMTSKAGALTPAGDGLWQLPDEEVQWVLSRRREDIPADLFGDDYVDAVNAVRDEFFKYQAWLRAEYDANGGRVIVDDKFVAEREEHEQWMASWSAPIASIDLGPMEFSDRLSDFYEDDSEDDLGDMEFSDRLSDFYEDSEYEDDEEVEVQGEDVEVQGEDEVVDVKGLDAN